MFQLILARSLLAHSPLAGGGWLASGKGLPREPRQSRELLAKAILLGGDEVKQRVLEDEAGVRQSLYFGVAIRGWGGRVWA